jgi:hypothetical protein
MEHAAYTIWITQTFGTPIPLPQVELENLGKIGAALRQKQ